MCASTTGRKLFVIPCFVKNTNSGTDSTSAGNSRAASRKNRNAVLPRMRKRVRL